MQASTEPGLDEGEAYAAKLREAGVPTTSARYNGIIHDFLMLNSLEDTESARSACARQWPCCGTRSAVRRERMVVRGGVAEVRRLRISVPEERLADLHRRLRVTRWPEPRGVSRPTSPTSGFEVWCTIGCTTTTGAPVKPS